ncbi:hypothetical protein DRQ21_09945 [Candidatus Fermentibacteria bacterium]|nr:MAG: hypothetical protein DRQ21_09945 [Candidatus Fermentibacteria bacterium]
MKRTVLYKRHKLLLALLEAFGSSVGAVDYMKYLFLLSQKQRSPSYHFVPHRFGCFSYQAYADKRSLIRKGLLEDSDVWELTSAGHGMLKELEESNSAAVTSVKREFGRYSGNELIRYVYSQFPFYALNSEIAGDLLSDSENAMIELTRPEYSGSALQSIGYEGLSLDEYLVRLFKAGTEVLVDVRKNAFSMKYGFSKKTLKSSTEALGMKYIHFPSLGIEGAKRKKLYTQKDYDDLFDDYERNVLQYRKQELDSLAEMVNSGTRIAVTCYEANQAQCHRTIVAREISRLTGIEVRNL